MATKIYFVKVSWDNPENPTHRLHANVTHAIIDFALDYSPTDQLLNNLPSGRRDNFTIDFMIERT